MNWYYIEVLGREGKTACLFEMNEFDAEKTADLFNTINYNAIGADDPFIRMYEVELCEEDESERGCFNAHGEIQKFKVVGQLVNE